MIQVSKPIQTICELGVATAKISWIILILLLFTVPAYSQTMNIEIDYMVLRDASNNILHSHKPQPNEVAAVVQMFACQGITLNIIVDDEIPHVNVMQRNASGSFFGNTGTGGFKAMKNTYFDHAGGWHYCIFGHQYENAAGDATCSSGLGEISGDDFVVTLGCFDADIGTPFDRASTLAHEFGHNLGLGHCGVMNCDNVGDDPINVASIMSYNFQLAGLKTNLLCQGLAPEFVDLFKDLDYSHGIMCALNEAQLDERFGTGLIRVDWDCDGVIEAGLQSHDLQTVADNSWCTATGTLQTLSDFNEWANIHDYAAANAKAQLEDLPEISCITAEEWTKFRKSLAWCAQPAVTNEPCIAPRIYFARPYLITTGTGACGNPYTGLLEAQANAQAGGLIFLRYGTYTEPVGNIVLNKRMTLIPTDNVVIQPTGAVNK